MWTRIILAISIGALASITALPASAQSQKALVERGKYLVNGPVACGNCHTQHGSDLRPIASKYLAGGWKIPSPVFVAYPRNITPDKDTGIGSWTDAQIIRAMRECVSKEGKTLGPPMPCDFYSRMSDGDVKAIVAYLRTVKPVHNEVPESQYKIPLKPEPPVKDVVAPPKSDKVAYGRYIVTIAHCMECHTPLVGPKRDLENQLGAGGFKIDYDGAIITTRNITSDKETGIGGWTDAQIKRAITKGIDKDGKQLIPLMPYPYLKNMTAEDLDAVVAYLRTVPPINKKNEPNPTLQSLLNKKVSAANRP